MAEEKTLNPDSVTLEDIKRMGAGEFRQWTFLRLNSIDEKLRGHDKRFGKIESMLWGLLIAIIATLLAAVFS